MQKESQFSDRLAGRMAAAGLNQASLGRLINAGQSTVNRWLSGTRPQPRMAMLLAAALSVRKEWLLDGTGPMEPSEEQKALARSILSGGSEFTNALLRTPHHGSSTVQEEPAEFRAGTPLTEAQRLHREIMQRLDDASRSADELAREVVKRRIDEYFDIVERNQPKP